MYKSTQVQVKGKRQKGFSLVEMMISMTLGMAAMAGVITMFANSVKNNSEGLKQIRLNQELRAVVDLMARDVRRSGYWRNADGTTANPFQSLSISGSDCITFSYDQNPYNTDAGNPLVENEDSFGFRLIDNTVKLRSNSATCASNNDWVSITTPDVVSVTDLTFTKVDTTDGCINLTSSTRDCDTAVSGDELSRIPYITISISGQLVGDSSVADTLVEAVAIRNTETETVP